MTAPRRYLALGDSYTIGEGIGAEDRWPVQLADALRSEGTALDAPEIIATTGWTTDELDAAIDAAAPVGPFDLVSLLIGVNDQYRGRDVSEYTPAFEALLQRAIGFAGGDAARVFVLAIPDWGVTPFGAHSGRDVAAIARELDAYNAAAAAICAARGVAFVDIAAVSRAHGGEAEMLADDGLHPSAALHTEWMQLALPVARGLLSRA
ncbi:SGNH/GDSL hydrolase family protein [Luteimonas terrae]|uniref:Lysophospholipase L1-like esterase n=1 Tax=Luteimonas terrae TaxID=1530191 RepID=A0ABU1XTD9_9GAMM|nr:GDSL-type esterase/lipase family protein [Luteimonas terrae]MDR7191833.1 lysophospholipase L1-like esterase [Luteimonas terrae]